jgi:hypothetical protein
VAGGGHDKDLRPAQCRLPLSAGQQHGRVVAGVLQVEQVPESLGHARSIGSHVPEHVSCLPVILASGTPSQHSTAHGVGRSNAGEYAQGGCDAGCCVHLLAEDEVGYLAELLRLEEPCAGLGAAERLGPAGHAGTHRLLLGAFAARVDGVFLPGEVGKNDEMPGPCRVIASRSHDWMIPAPTRAWAAMPGGSTW